MNEKPQSFKKKWENYWYHYTPQTLVGILAAVIALTFIIDVFSNKTYDLTIGFISRQYLSYDVFKADEQAIGASAIDVDGDGEKNVSIDIMSVKPSIENENDMNMQEKIMLSFVVGEIRLYIFEKEYAQDYADMLYPLDNELTPAQLEGGVKVNGKTVAASLRGNALAKKWGLRGEELYIALVDIVPAHKKLKHIDELFKSSVNAMHYILNQK